MARYNARPYERYEMSMEESNTEIETIKGGPIDESRGLKLLPFDKFDRRDGLGTTSHDPLFDIICDDHTTRTQRQLALTELLLRQGADVSSQVYAPAPDSYVCPKFESRDGHLRSECLAPIAPLALGAERKHHNVVELLLDQDADPNLKIVHHAHGLLRAKDLERRWKHRRDQKEQNPAESDIDSDPETEEWKGYWSVATALTWAPGEVRELLLRCGVDPAMEELIGERGCEIEERQIDEDLWSQYELPR